LSWSLIARLKLPGTSALDPPNTPARVFESGRAVSGDDLETGSGARPGHPLVKMGPGAKISFSLRSCASQT
jgi:hypothetical protein